MNREQEINIIKVAFSLLKKNLRVANNNMYYQKWVRDKPNICFKDWIINKMRDNLIEQLDKSDHKGGIDES